MPTIKVNGTVIKLCRSFNEAKRMAAIFGGTISGYTKGTMPKSAMLRYGDSQVTKREMYREIYGEYNHGYHFTKGKSRL